MGITPTDTVRFDDPSTLATCFSEHASTVRARVRRWVPDVDAEDVVQQVFLDLWRTRDRYDPERPIRPWLLGIADRRAIDYVRRRTRGQAVHEAEAEASADVLDLSGGPAEQVTDAAIVRDALAALPDEQREALVLAYFGDLTQSQIAERLGVPIGTVKARSFRGLRSMAALLAPVEDA